MQTHFIRRDELFSFRGNSRLNLLRESRDMLNFFLLAILILILFLCISDFVVTPMLNGLAKPKPSGLRTEEHRNSNAAKTPGGHYGSGGNWGRAR
jgi:hypothetical protein